MQLCHRDPSGVLGCLPDRPTAATVNANASLGSLLTSREFLMLRPETRPLAPFALQSLYGPDLFNSAVTTDMYVSDLSSGLFTNVFTLEPRRYGLAAGIRF